jgi:hypothetical protein
VNAQTNARHLPLDDAAVLRLQAEVEADRLVVAILRSLRGDPTAGKLRAELLGHVLSGRDAGTALLLLGREGGGASAVGRIEAKLDALLAGLSAPDGHVHPTPAAPLGDLFGARDLPGSPEPEPAERDAPPDAGDGRLARLVKSGLGQAGDGQGARPSRIGARGPNHVRGGRPVGSGNCLSALVRDHARRQAAEILGRPVSPSQVTESAPPAMRDEIAACTPTYVRTVLYRNFIRIERDLFWPADLKLPPGLGLDDAWWSGLPAPPVAAPPAATHAVADGARSVIDAYNATAPAGRKVVPGEEAKATRVSREAGKRGRL